MRKDLLITLLTTFACSFASADMFSPAMLDITCAGEKPAPIVRILSDSTGSELIVDGKSIDKSDAQLTAGTEGAGPYLQYVKGGYNVTVFGKDFERLFYDSSQQLLNGKASASIWHKDITTKADCSGVIAF